MLRVGEDLCDGTLFHDLTRVHDQHPFAHMTNDEEIMRDEKQREVDVLLELSQHAQVARLGGDVERGRRLVGDEQARLAGERDRAAGALPHPAAELMGKLLLPLLSADR